jgi:parallel beta-helix repeat protein
MKRQAFQMVLLLWSLSSMFPNSSASAATYYVATNGSDSNPGTESYPWRTIQKAANMMLPGDTVLIRQGIYQEKVTPMVSGTEGRYITYRNYGAETVVIDANNGTRDSCIRVDGKMYLKFMGLRLTGASGPSDLRAGFHASDQSGYLLLDNITADNSRFGILIHGKYAPVSHVTITNCTVSNNTGHGIFLYRRVYDSVVGPNNHMFSNAGESYTLRIRARIRPDLRSQSGHKRR